MSYLGWKPYVPVAERRAKAEQATSKAKKTGKGYAPVALSDRIIAKTFWGKAWCDNLKTYSDYSNRLPRGLSYVRNGSVVDLKITPGKVLAKVMGSRLYTVEIDVDAVSAQRWKALAKDCTHSIDSLVELLQGKFSKAVMQHLCQPDTGLFPTPKQMHFTCSCPDWATMCKHVSATLYGVGARLDGQPELLFTLRKVDAAELVNQAAVLPVNSGQRPTKARAIEEAALSELFGIELGEAAGASAAAPKKTRAPTGKSTSPKPAAAKKVAVKKSGIKKAAVKKPAVKKLAVKNVTAKKPAAKKVVAKKASTKKAALKKTSKTTRAAGSTRSAAAAPKKAAPKKTSSKKAMPKKSLKTVLAVRPAKASPAAAKKTVRAARAKAVSKR